MIFQQKLDNIVKKNNSLFCLGLDPNRDKIPPSIASKNHPLFEFNKKIIEASFDLVCCYKPNSAFYESQGVEGIKQLKMTCDFLKSEYPQIPIIYDAKRGDIGATNEQYASYIFDYIRADAVTLHPFSGKEGMKEFLNREDKGCIIWCKSSNHGGGEFQNLLVEGEPLYIKIAKNVSSFWNKNDNCMLVVGATYPTELKEIRSIVGDMTLLIPGIGVQGGSVEESVKAGLNSKKRGVIMSTSRAVLYASSEKDFAQKAREEAQKLKDEINKYR